MFDHETERCLHCDGHFRHFDPCPYFREDDPANNIPVALRVAIHAIVDNPFR